MKLDELKPMDQIEGNNFGEQSLDNQPKKAKKGTGAKKSKKGIAVLIIVGLLAAGGTAYIGTQHVEKATQAKRAYERAESIVALYQTGDLCSLDETIYSTKNHDTVICGGETLVSVLTAKGVKYCEILDQYYTKDGRNIAIVTLEVEHTDRINPETIIDTKEDATYYIVPEGYEYINGYYQKTTTENRTIVTEVREDGDYTKLSIPGVAVKAVKSVDVVKTESYDKIVASDFVCNVDDEFEKHLNSGLSEATYQLTPKKN